MSRKRDLINKIRQLIGKPFALIFKDENGTYLNGNKLNAHKEKEIRKTHQVEVIEWIETEQSL